MCRFCEGSVLRCEVARKNMYLKEDSASKRGKYEHPPGAYPGYPPAAAPGAAPYYPPAGAPPGAAAPAANRQYVSGKLTKWRQGSVFVPVLIELAAGRLLASSHSM